MKKIAILFILSLTFPEPGSAQLFKGGLTGGLSVNQIDGDRFAGYNHAGAIAGLWIRTRLNAPTQLQTELRYFGKGAGVKTTPENPVYYRVRLHYIELPVMLHWDIFHKASAQLGVAGGYLMKGMENLDGEGFLDPDPAFRNMELSGQAGFGYAIFDELAFFVRFSYSLVPIRNHPGDQSWYLDRGQFNNSLAFTLSYTLMSRR